MMRGREFSSAAIVLSSGLRIGPSSQLGLSQWATIEWRERWGLRWPGLLPLLFTGLLITPPQILVIHLGGNDLGMIMGKALVIQAWQDLQRIMQAWPGIHILWSAIVPWWVWRGVADPKAMDRALKKANREIRKSLREGMDGFIPHPGLQADLPDLYRQDGVHLSDLGNNIFLQDLQQGLWEILDLPWGTRA